MLAARTMSEIPYPTKFVIDPKFFGKKKTGAPATAAPADSASDAATQSETSAVVAQSETSAAAECADAPVSDDAETAETT